ncbi:MAG: DUF4349 domain-containing protein [Butyrivibrio sp.]|nr:DUF4349 domain-containing protein [Butyrivibrio sp.]
MKKKFVVGIISVLIGASMLLGCGGSDSSGNYDYSMESAADEALYESNALYEKDMADVTAGGGEEATEQVQDTSRKLITTVNIDAETENFDETLALVDTKVKELGGYVESSNIYNGSSYSGDNVSRDADITIRIPATKLDSFIETVDGNTNITNKSTNVEDVTLNYVDIESRKKALKAEEERLLEIVESAETVEDIITVEERLSDVRYQLESIESQLRTYDNKISYSTVNLAIEEVVKFTPSEKAGPIERMGTGFMESVMFIVTAAVELCVWFVSHIPQIVVLLIIGLICFAVIKKINARNRQKMMSNPAPAMQRQGYYDPYTGQYNPNANQNRQNVAPQNQQAGTVSTEKTEGKNEQ